jgi:hypothetical protein
MSDDDSAADGLSLKRTDLLVGRGFFCAAAKSGARVGLLGVEDEVVVLRSNWEERSASWDLRRGSCDVMDLGGGLVTVRNGVFGCVEDVLVPCVFGLRFERFDA